MELLVGTNKKIRRINEYVKKIRINNAHRKLSAWHFWFCIGNSQSKLKVLLNDTMVSLDNEVYINEKGQIMCPLRELSQKLDYEINWNNDDRSITLTNESQVIKLNIGEPNVDVNGEIIKLKTSPILKEDITFVPIKFFSNALDLIIGLNSKQQVISINQPKKSKEPFLKMSIDTEKQDELQAYMKALEEYQNFHGSVLLAKDGEVLLNKGYGFADFEQNTMNKSQTKFAIGSITKQFTAMAIMQLKEKRLLDTEDKLSKYLPDFPNGDLISIHNLLTHTSVLVNYTNLQEFLTFDMNNRNPMSVINLIKGMPLQFSPGEQFFYSNTNYVLLGIIVEKIADMPLIDYLQENIFDPLDIVNTGIHYAESNQLYDATPYFGFLEVIPIDDDLVLTQAYGAGNMYSTVEDLYRWDRALKSEQIVKNETLDEILTGYIPTSETESYGYGWMIANTDVGKQIYHGDNTLGFTGNIARYPDKDLVIIILVNNANYDVISLTNTLNSIVLDKDYEIPEALKEIEIEDSSLYDNYAGEYELAPNIIIEITKEDDRIFAQLTGQDRFEIFPRSESEYFYKIVDAKITFERDETGNVTNLILHQSGLDITANKIN